MKSKAGDMIFLTRRNTRDYRGFISKSIARLTRNKKQNLEDVKVHAAIIYSNDGVLFVRDMDSKGNENYTLMEYVEIYGNRMEIYHHNLKIVNYKLFNESCLNDDVNYDYLNTFVWQLSRELCHIWFGWNTPYKRMCSEDVQREFNLLRWTFKYPEQVNPNQLFEYLKKENI